MARRENELFIGKEYLNVEGRSIKHPALIKHYGTININKLKPEPIKLVGLDLETDHITSELKLLGFYRKGMYTKHNDRFLVHLFYMIKWCHYNEHHIAYWNKLDPQVLFKQFLYRATEKQQFEALSRFGKTSGQWDKKLGQWHPDSPPVIEIDFYGYKFGIRNVIRSSIQFFFYNKGNTQIKTVWAYDIAQLYQGSLEDEAMYDIGTKDKPKKRLPYYTKVDESAHLVDWKRYETDNDYRINVVDFSNQLDARAVYDLGMIIQHDFKNAFGYYMGTLVSSGSMARAAIVAITFNHYKVDALDDDAKETPEYQKAVDDIRSIAFMSHYDYWLDNFGGDILKNLYAISTETYSGGYIEALRLGYTDTAYWADIASAYPANTARLYDLRNSTLTSGHGEPPRIKYSYCFIRGTVTIPDNINIHPLTVKHPTSKETNIRPVGIFKGSYFLEERDYLMSLGATFTDEEWVNVETEGKLSPLARTSIALSDLRNALIKEHNSSEYVVKKTNNSQYGIQFEAVPTYEEYNNMYSKKSIKELIEVTTNVLWTDQYDFKINNKDMDVIVDNAIKMLKDFKTKKEVSNYISNEIMLKAYAVDVFKDNELKHEYNIYKSYIRNINLVTMVDEIEHKYDDKASIKKRVWHNKDGMYYDDVVVEIEQHGIVLEGKTSQDQLLYMFDRYDYIKETLKAKVGTLEELVNLDVLESLRNEVFETIYNNLVDLNDVVIENVGFRAGEFFNPIYAAWITSQTRIFLSKAGNAIESKGGKVVLLMTDSIFWEGSADMLPNNMYKKEKTLGYFEPPKKIHDLLCLGSGRYEYTDENGRQQSKQRGLNATDWHHENGIDVSKFSWYEAITNPKYRLKDNKVSVNVRSLISVGVVLHSPKRIEKGKEVGHSIDDLGKIVENKREVEPIIGYTKRIFNEVPNVDDLSKRMIQTRPLRLGHGMFGKDTINDQTLPLLREKMFLLEAKSTKQKRAKVNRRKSKKYYHNKKDEIREVRNTNYSQLRTYGYTRNEARKMANWSAENLMQQLIKDEKI